MQVFSKKKTDFCFEILIVTVKVRNRISRQLTCLCILKSCLKMNVLGLSGKVLVAEDYRGGFCEKLLEVSLLPNRASASRFQDGPAAGRGNQQQWYASVITHVRTGWLHGSNQRDE